MTESSSWLPDLVRLQDSGGDWSRYVEDIYRYFQEDFVHSKPSWPQRRWAVKRYPVYDGKEATFWHLISEGKTEDERVPNLHRCERIRWPRPIIDNAREDNVKLWLTERGRSKRIVLAQEDFSYVVVLEDRSEFVMLWTAYPVERCHRRRKLEKEYEAYRASING